MLNLLFIVQGDRTFLGWVGEDAHTTMFCGSNEPDWTVINANQGVSYNYNVSGKPVRFEVEDLKCIHLSSIADNSSGNLLLLLFYQSFNVI